jgi:glycosyltransferase involved in cell wall biosynthesis
VSGRRLRVLVVAPERHPLRQPHAGGLESVVWNRVRWLRSRGHEVVLCAAEGSDFVSGQAGLTLPSPQWMRGQDASDSDYPAGHRRVMQRAFAHVRRMIDRHGVDVVDNHSLHADPIGWSTSCGVPVVTTLHTPPLPEMVRAAAELPRDAPHRFLAVSQYTALAWSAEGVDAFVFPNGVDPRQWRAGPGGDAWVWFGRIVPEKAPHLAIQAARRAGARLVLAGRVGDASYFAREIAPLLDERTRYVGALHQPRLSALVGASAVALVTPMWAEPFGLVLAEALTTGTPVAAFDSGGISEVLSHLPGTAIVTAGDVEELARTASALALSARSPEKRRALRHEAAARFSLDQRHREIERVLLLAAHGTGAPAATEAVIA